MTEVEFSRLLSVLSTTAKALNQKSDSINDVIKALEDKLRQINLGLEVWLTHDAIDERVLYETHGGDVEDERESGEEREELGFVKMNDAWCLAVRTATYKYESDRATFKFTAEVVRLLECPRKFRIAALQRFPELVKLMNVEAQEAVDAIEAAQKFVE